MSKISNPVVRGRGRPVEPLSAEDWNKVFAAIRSGVSIVSNIAVKTGVSRHRLYKYALNPAGAGKNPEVPFVVFYADSTTGRRGRPVLRAKLTSVGNAVATLRLAKAAKVAA